MQEASATLVGYPTIVSHFGYSPLGPALWQPDPHTGLDSRDLSLLQASDDALYGRHLRAGGTGRAGVEIAATHDQFIFLFVLAGTVTLMSDSVETKLGALASATRFGRGADTQVELSPDAECILLKSTPATADQLGSGGNGQWTITAEAPDQYVVGDGPRSFFRYRDLRTSEATDRRVHIHVVGATRPMDSGTGWHSHSMGQIFYVLRGWADLAVERQPAVRMTTGDAMCISKRMRHNVPSFSEDYLVLEMCVPADYDTVDAEPRQ
jgi:quercetin dioxygenase-like cupin family protein